LRKNVIFIGCSLTDEIDISYALAKIKPESDLTAKTSRIFVTSSAPNDYTSRDNLKAYGITDVIVGDYTTFYLLVEAILIAKENADEILKNFAFENSGIEYSQKQFVKYLVQDGWRQRDDPYSFSIERNIESDIKKLLDEPLVIIWGNRFTGKTTLLYRILNEVRTRKSFFIRASTSSSDSTVNELFKIKNALIAIDVGGVQYEHLKLIARKADVLRENNTTIIVAVSKNDLNAFGQNCTDDAISIRAQFFANEMEKLITY